MNNTASVQPAADVLIVGGGAVGASIAFFLSRRGASVRLLERDELASQASGAAAGMLAPICESEGLGPFFELGVASLGMLTELCGVLRQESGIDPQLSLSGILRIATSEVEATDLREHTRSMGTYGLEWIDRAAVLEHHPGASHTVLGAMWSPSEGHVLSPLLTRAYGEAARRRGARIETGIQVTGLLRDGNRVTGVQTTDGDRPAGHVILAAGAWTRLCAPWFGKELDLVPIRGQILSLGQPLPLLRHILWGAGGYIVPKLDGTVVVGATMERAGYDRRNTAAGVAELLTFPTQLVPAFGAATFLRAWSGLRPATADRLPVVGAVPGAEGLSLATGHYRNGVLLSAVTGKLVSEALAGSNWPEVLESFTPSRAGILVSSAAGSVHA